MWTIFDGVRVTVHGVLAASRHVLWYVDWKTGGQRAVRRRDQRLDD